MKHLVVLTGAGMSAESGISTFNVAIFTSRDLPKRSTTPLGKLFKKSESKYRYGY